MTRAKKIMKLGNAIRNFRGAVCNGSWIRSPQPHRARDVVRWLAALGFPPKPELERICGFKTRDEMDAWLKELGGAA